MSGNIFKVENEQHYEIEVSFFFVFYYSRCCCYCLCCYYCCPVLFCPVCQMRIWLWLKLLYGIAVILLPWPLVTNATAGSQTLLKIVNVAYETYFYPRINFSISYKFGTFVIHRFSLKSKYFWQRNLRRTTILSKLFSAIYSGILKIWTFFGTALLLIVH